VVSTFTAGPSNNLSFSFATLGSHHGYSSFSPFPLTLLFAIGSWYFIERRFLRLKQRHLPTSEVLGEIRFSSHEPLDIAAGEHRIEHRPPNLVIELPHSVNGS
jgi:hypothetical protein